MSTLERRRFLRTLLAAALGGPQARASTTGFRRFRADAILTPLGIPIYSRRGVGGAYVAVEESVAGLVTRITLRFAAGSAPERAAGLNRFGFLEENVECENHAAVHAEYVGLMTSSPEKDLDQAQRALRQAAARAGVDAIHGSAGGGLFRSRLLHTDLEPQFRWENAPALAGTVRTLLAREAASGAVVREGRTDCAETFLYVVRQAMLDPRPESEAPFLYNGARYRLQTRKRADPSMGTRFAERQLVGPSSRVERLSGDITNLDRRSKSEFKLWLEAGRPALPIRFEYHARSFLRLAFEYAPPAAEVHAVPHA